MDENTPPAPLNGPPEAPDPEQWGLAQMDEERARDKALLKFLQEWTLTRSVSLNYKVRETEAEATELRTQVASLQARLDDTLAEPEEAPPGPNADTLGP